MNVNAREDMQGGGDSEGLQAAGCLSIRYNHSLFYKSFRVTSKAQKAIKIMNTHEPLHKLYVINKRPRVC